MHSLQAYAVVAALCIYAQHGEDATKRGGWRPCIGNYIVDLENHGKIMELCF